MESRSEQPTSTSLGALLDEGGRDEGDRRRWQRLVSRPWFRIVVALYVVTIGYLAVQMELGRWQEETDAFASAAVGAICSSWSVEEFERLSGPALMLATTQEERVSMLDTFGLRLGALRATSSSSGGPMVILKWGRPRVAAQYEIEARFAYGTGVIWLEMEKSAGAWTLSRFAIRSDELGR